MNIKCKFSDEFELAGMKCNLIFENGSHGKIYGAIIR